MFKSFRRSFNSCPSLKRNESSIKPLMTGPARNSEYCFSETRLNAPPRWTTRSKDYKTHCFTRDQSLSVLLYLPTQKLKKTRRNRLLDAGWFTNLMRLQWARPDHVRVESWNCCFPKYLVSFDLRHVTRSLPKQQNSIFHSVAQSDLALTELTMRISITPARDMLDMLVDSPVTLKI